MENKNSEEINLYKWYKMVRENKKIFLYSFSFSLIISLLYLYFCTPLYKSSISIYEHGQSSTSMDGMSGMNLSDISSMMQMIGGNTNQADTSIPFYIPDIVDSRTLKEKILTVKWKVGKNVPSTTLMNLWEINKEDSLENIEIALEELDDMIEAKLSDTGLYIISVLSQDRYLSRDIALFISEYISEYINDKILSLTLKHREFIENQMGETKKELTESEENLMNFHKLHPMVLDNPALLLQQARLERNLLVNQEVYITLRQQYELAKIEESKKDQVFTIIDEARPSYEPFYPRKILVILTAIILGLSMSLSIILIINFKKEIDREKNNS